MVKVFFKKALTIILIGSLFVCSACGNKDNMSEVKEENEQTETVKDKEDANAEDANTSYDAEAFFAKFPDIEKQSDELKNSIDNDDMSQTDYNLKTGELYELWDNALNELWGILNNTLSSDELAKITEEQQTWISDKEKQVKDAGAEAEGGSMQPMLENMKAADLTEGRVRELIKLLPGGDSITSSDNNETASDSQSAEKVLFDSFLAGEVEATISDKLMNKNVLFDTAFNAGNSFNIKTLDSLNTMWEPINSATSKISYTRFENGSKKAYGVSFMYQLEATAFTEFFVMTEKDGKLIITFVMDGWDRRYPTFNNSGVVFDFGSNGAGAHSSLVYVPTADFEYVTLYEEEDNYAGWDFYDAESGEPIKPINDIMAQVSDGGRDDIEDVVYSKVKVNGSTYYYYLKDGITQDIVDFIDEIASDNGFTFDGKDKADAAIEEYAKTLSADEIYKNDTSADWKDK